MACSKRITGRENCHFVCDIISSSLVIRNNSASVTSPLHVATSHPTQKLKKGLVIYHENNKDVIHAISFLVSKGNIHIRFPMIYNKLYTLKHP